MPLRNTALCQAWQQYHRHGEDGRDGEDRPEAGQAVKAMTSTGTDRHWTSLLSWPQPRCKARGTVHFTPARHSLPCRPQADGEDSGVSTLETPGRVSFHPDLAHRS